jgi:tRNA(fMet)-specific endonuclease VapC
LRRYLLDTGSASDLINHRGEAHAKAREAVARGDRVGIGMPVLGELYAGVELSASREKNLDLLRRALAALFVWPFDQAAAEEYGRLFATLRRLGRPMQQIDIQIAAIVRSLGHCTVVTKDSDLAAVPGLTAEDWSGP